MAVCNPHVAAARIIQDAGGELVGRTRLQKIGFLLRLAGFENEFSFEYRHYGPFSEDLAQAIDIAAALGWVHEEERTAEWGGRYSIYKLDHNVSPSDLRREHFVQMAKHIDAVELELAATAAYIFAFEGIGRSISGNPWEETRRRKPGKASDERVTNAAFAYEKLRQLDSDHALPALPAP